MINTSWFTLIELVIWIAISSIVILMFWNFLLSYYEDSVELKNNQTEFSDVTLWLKSLQKIIFENSVYFTFNYEILNWWSCNNKITDWIGLWDLCHSKFWFVVKNEWWLEEEYKLELVDCNVWKVNWKQLVYKNAFNTIPLLSTCIYSKTWYPIEQKIEFINNDIKEKIFRYYLFTENWIYMQTFFVH